MVSIVQKLHKKNSVSRNVFDLSNNIDFTTCAGQLLPVRCDEVVPNSEWRFNQSYFLRTLPLVVPSFGRMKVHFDNFFVPYRLLGNDIQSIIVGNNRGMMSNYNAGTYTNSNKCLPYTSLFDLSYIYNPAWQELGQLSDAADISQEYSSQILVNALGYGTPVMEQQVSRSKAANFGSRNGDNDIVSVAANTVKPVSVGNGDGTSTAFNPMSVSILPFLAYQKIYQDYYRNKLWEEENRASYYLESSDYGSKFSITDLAERGMLEMRYHDLDKDRILGCVPDVSNILSRGVNLLQSVNRGSSGTGLDSAPGTSIASGLDKNQVPFGSAVNSSNVDVRALSALSFRRLEAFQKFAEITELNKNDYKHQVAAHFGFSPSDLNSDYCQYLGGFEDIVNISEVENTTSSQPASLSGKGVSSGSSRQFSFHAQEHGIVMTICYILPLVDYSNLFVERYCTHLNRYDFVQPEFDNIGFEPIRLFDVYNEMSNLPVAAAEGGQQTATTVFGYLPRYWEYKTRLDVAKVPFYNGDNKEVNLNYGSYIIRYPYKRLFEGVHNGTFYKAVKAVPSLTDGLFSVEIGNGSTLQNSPFVVTFYNRCSAMLPLSVTGLPY